MENIIYCLMTRFAFILKNSQEYVVKTSGEVINFIFPFFFFWHATKFLGNIKLFVVIFNELKHWKKKLTNVILDLMLSCSKGSVHFSISYLWLHTQSIIILFPLSFMPSFSFCVFFLFFLLLFSSHSVILFTGKGPFHADSREKNQD